MRYVAAAIVYLLGFESLLLCVLFLSSWVFNVSANFGEWRVGLTRFELDCGSRGLALTVLPVTQILWTPTTAWTWRVPGIDITMFNYSGRHLPDMAVSLAFPTLFSALLPGWLVYRIHTRVRAGQNQGFAVTLKEPADMSRSDAAAATTPPVPVNRV